MKLLNHHNRINLAATLIILFLSSICYYSLLHYMLINQLDNDLKVEEKEINTFINKYGYLPDTTAYEAQKINFFQTASPVKREFTSKDLLSKKKHEGRRMLLFPVSVKGKNYMASVSKSQEETEDLLQLIVGVTFIVVIFLLASLFFINRLYMKKLWKPFYHSLSAIQTYNLTSAAAITFSPSNIEEFNALNKAIAAMADHTKQEYEALKTFTENASHEIQTPLAIIKAKLELLSQADNLSEEQLNIILGIQTPVNRLSKLNQSLLLLTKIENNQFSENGEISIPDIISRYTKFYEELFWAKKIIITTEMIKPENISMNESLADILISNLIGNAIRHNIENGFIKISFERKFFTILNSGLTNAAAPDSLFRRFKKDNSSSESLGLGLSIVKKICEKYDFNIQYYLENTVHIITVSFN